MSDYKNGCRENPDLDTYGWWQTKPYDPPIAENGRIPLNEFGNVELFQPCMLPKGTVHLKKMPNLNRICRKLKIDCAAAVVGFDAHGGFSHAVIDGWVVCQEHEETVLAAYQEEEVRNNLKMIAKQQERVWGNWKRIIKSLQIREHLKFKYGTENTDGYKKTVGLNEINVTDNEDDIVISEPKKVNKGKSVIKKTAAKSRNRPTKKKISEEQKDSEESDDSHDSKDKKSIGKKKKMTEKKDIFAKIAAQNQIEIDKNSETSENLVNQAGDDLMLSEGEDSE